MALETRAYAKINLGLAVLRRREDGYHDIETVFHRINLFDRLTFELADAISVKSSSDEIPPEKGNLCFEAATLLREHCGLARGVAITLEKCIPVGAGLGGGSSDAASTLLALRDLWSIHIDDVALSVLALRLGSDVPYFLKDGSALAHGRGEVLEHFSLRLPYAILVCNPGIHVATKWAYGKVVPHADQQRPAFKDLILSNLESPERLSGLLTNDFEPPVFQEFPVIGNLKQRLLQEGASLALMSGSGSTVFGLFRKEETAAALGERLSKNGYVVSLTAPMFTL